MARSHLPPEPTEFYVIPEGDPTAPLRITTVRFAPRASPKPVLGEVVRAVVTAAYAREEAEIAPPAVVTTG